LINLSPTAFFTQQHCLKGRNRQQQQQQQQQQNIIVFKNNQPKTIIEKNNGMVRFCYFCIFEKEYFFGVTSKYLFFVFLYHSS
jgi:hypothetical protein